jgi:hypothetical protein
MSRGEGMKKQGVTPSVVDRCRNPAALEKIFQKVLKNLLTNPLKYAIIYIPRRQGSKPLW